MTRGIVSLTTMSLLFAAAISSQITSVKPTSVVRLRGNVLAVEDSDRLKIATDEGKVLSVTLQSVDAPDEKQQYFKKAKKRLAELVEAKDVTVIIRSTDSGESYGIVYAGADDVGLKLIEDGLAWFAPNRSSAQSRTDCESYIKAETAAKNLKAGLWGEKDAVAPWTFRGEALRQITTETANVALPQNTETPRRSQPVPGRAYILGPRGGCYYLNDQGIKVYVKDKTLCQKP